MEFLNRNKLPNFTARLDLKNEELNDMINVFVTSINEIAGRVQIIKNTIPEEERIQFAVDKEYPILQLLDSLVLNLDSLSETVNNNQQVTSVTINNLASIFSELETRFNSLDDRAALKVDVAALMDKIIYIQDHSVPSINPVTGTWMIGNFDTGMPSKGDTGNIGPQGDIGPSGPQGQVGPPLKTMGTKPTSGDLPATGNPGEGWVIAGELWVWAADSLSWINMGTLQGPQGEEGPIGPIGIQGPPGVAGPGVPAGGTTGQFMTKKSGTDYDSEWTTVDVVESVTIKNILVITESAYNALPVKDNNTLYITLKE